MMKNVKAEGPSEATMETIAIALQRIELSVDKQSNEITRRLNTLETRLEGVAALITKSDATSSQLLNNVLTTAINQLAAVSQSAIDRDRTLAASNDGSDSHVLAQLLSSMKNQQANINQQVHLQQQQQLRAQMQYQQLLAVYQQQQQQQMLPVQPTYSGFPVVPGPQIPDGSGVTVPGNFAQRPSAPVLPAQQVIPSTVSASNVPATPVKPGFPNFNITSGSPTKPVLPTSSLATASITASNKPLQPLTGFPKVGGTSTTAAAPTSSIFGTPPAPVVTTGAPVVSSGATTPAPIAEGGEDEPEAFQPTAHYEPVIPLPALVNVSTGEEGAEILFDARGKLFRWTDIEEGKKGFKERGIGQVKILRDPGAKNARLVMRREQVLKVCANHIINATCKLTRNNGKPAVTYPCKDYSEGKLTDEIFSIRFKDDETVNKFIEIFEAHNSATDIGSAQLEFSEKSPEELKPAATIGFDDKFKKQAGEWECETCYVVNKVDVDSCESCNTGRDGTTKKEIVNTFKPAAPAADKPAFSFGIKSAGAAATSATPTSDAKSSTIASRPFSFNYQTTPATATPESKSVSNIFNKLATDTTSTPDTKSTSTLTFAGFGKVSTSAAPLSGNTSGTSVVEASNKLHFGSASATPASDATTATSLPSNKGTPATKSASALNFSFGKPSTPASDKVETPFKFVPTPTQQTTKPATAFGNAATPTAGSTFGGIKLFGNSASPAVGFSSTNHPANTSLSFGSLVTGKSFLDKQSETPAEANKSFGEHSKFLKGAQSSKTDTDKTGGDEANDCPEDFIPDAEYAPVIPLPEKYEVVTGEENEEVLFEHKGKLFIYLPESKETKERGAGPVKILHNPTTDVYRVVMRRDQVHKICANFRLQKNAGMTCGDKPGIRNCCIFRAVDFTDNSEGTNVLFLLRFREDEVYNDFKSKFNSIVGFIPSSESSSGKSTTKPVKATDTVFSPTVSGRSAPTLPNIGAADDEPEDEDEETEDGEYEDDMEEQEIIFSYPCVAVVTEAYTSPLAKNKKAPIVYKNTKFTLFECADVFTASLEEINGNDELIAHCTHYIDGNYDFKLSGKHVSYVFRDNTDKKTKSLSIEFRNADNAQNVYEELGIARDSAGDGDDYD